MLNYTKRPSLTTAQPPRKSQLTLLKFPGFLHRSQRLGQISGDVAVTRPSLMEAGQVASRDCPSSAVDAESRCVVSRAGGFSNGSADADQFILFVLVLVSFELASLTGAGRSG